MEREIKRRYEKRCYCGNVMAYLQDKEPKKYECTECGRKGDWSEVFEYPKVDIKEFKQEDLPAPVFLNGEPHLVIDNQYLPYDEGMLKFLKRQVKRKLDEIKKLEDKLNINKAGDKK